MSELIRTASELFDRGHHSSVAAVCQEALARDPDDNPARVLLARALIALRQDQRAQRELGEILRRDGNSPMAFQLLGEIAYRQDDLASAEIYFREAWRLDPGNTSARIWLDVTTASGGPRNRWPTPDVEGSGPLELPEPAGRRRFAGGSALDIAAPEPRQQSTPPTSKGRSQSQGTVRLRAPSSRVRTRSERPPPPPDDRVRDDRFGGHMVRLGVLTARDLPRVLAYHRSHRVRVGEAAVALGFIKPQKLHWAALAFHCQRPDSASPGPSCQNRK